MRLQRVLKHREELIREQEKDKCRLQSGDLKGLYRVLPFIGQALLKGSYACFVLFCVYSDASERVGLNRTVPYAERRGIEGRSSLILILRRSELRWLIFATLSALLYLSNF